jgi:tRNA nucleotidyltransferase (CCA-adding enzyme)
MKSMVAAGEVDHLVPERVWQEIQSALQCTTPSAFLQTLRTCGALKILLPEVDALYGVPQRVEYHPEIDAGIHTEMVCDMAARLAPGDGVIGFAALTHDLGKALTNPQQWPKHIGHEHLGIQTVEIVCDRWKVPNDYRQLAVHACREHLNIHRLQELRPETIHDLIARIDGFRRPERSRQLALVCEADKRGRLGLSETAYPSAALLQNYFEAAQGVQARDLNLSGLHGPDIGEALRKARIAAISAIKSTL